MRRVSLLIAAVVLFLAPRLYAQADSRESKEARDTRMQWWRQARFGLFIHWGLYAIPAGEWGSRNDYGEWIRTSAQIPLGTYDTLMGRFNPTRFDARSWVRLAKDAGMKYIVITSKHHDGFCLFETRATSFNVMSTPFRRDILKELATACREEGIRLCFYYSIMDWHHPDYLPRRAWETSRSSQGAVFDRYVDAMKTELKELLTGYGPIGVLWFDGEWESTWNPTRGNDLYAYVRSLQPDIIINNRVGAGRSGMEGFNQEGEYAGDFGTPEQEVPAGGLPDVDWETCMTMNDHWGYNKADTNFKSADSLIHMLVDIASKGGNFLLNVGPTSEGLFPPASIARLRAIGRWMKTNGDAIHGTIASPFPSTPWGRCTQKVMADGSVRLFLHMFHWPPDGRLICTGIGSTPIANGVFLLADPHHPLPWRFSRDTLTVDLPPVSPDSVDAVLAMDFPERPIIYLPPRISTAAPIFIDSATVTISPPASRGEVRYTVDGSSPTTLSPLAAGPLVITRSATVSAQTFAGDHPVSVIVRRRVERDVPLPATSADGLKKGVRFEYFEGDWDSLPPFDLQKIRESGVAGAIDLRMRKVNERFGLRFRGYLRAPADGVYRFATISDDGSRFSVDGRRVVENDGLHGSTLADGYIALARGEHPFKLEYFNKTGGMELRLQWAAPGLPLTDIDSTFFSTREDR